MQALAPFATQDPKVVSIFEVLASHVVDTVFNHIYSDARARARKAGTSITDEFVGCVQAFVTGVKHDEKCYNSVVQELHRHFAQVTRHKTLSFAEFVNRVVAICVPEGHFRVLATRDKDELLSSVVCDLIANLAAHATGADMLRRVVDGHEMSPEVTVRMLQDAAVRALLTKRAALQNAFLRKLGQATDEGSPELVGDMKRALVRLVKEKAKLAEDLDAAEADLRAAKKKLRDSRESEAKLRRLVDLLRAGRDEGPAAVGARLRVPRRDTLAEAEADADAGGGGGRRRPRTAAGRGRARGPPADDEGSEDDDSGEDEGDEDDSDESESPEEEAQRRRGLGGGARTTTTTGRGGSGHSATPAVASGDRAPAPKAALVGAASAAPASSAPASSAPAKAPAQVAAPATVAPSFFNASSGGILATAQVATAKAAPAKGAAAKAAAPKAAAAASKARAGVAKAPAPKAEAPAKAPAPGAERSAMLSALLADQELEELVGAA